MIRLKNRQYPFWIQWDGSEETWSQTKGIIEDHIKQNGFNHFDALVDLVDGKDKSAAAGDKAFGVTATKKGSTKKPTPSKPKGKTLGL